ncbi:hypothetical protein [Pseudomonas yangonensis]|uniref:hypothetical protein n=1 Tax=Pseudomonas yangonensis TaxID=2579922 RepID=UPI00137B6F74|nr:hypothetical protein [Pseudomonas yangonensis]
MDKSTQTNGDIHCAVCDRNTRVPGYGQQHGTLQAIWGYGSQHDGERCINTLFDDAQLPDDKVFGRVAHDDYFSES